MGSISDYLENELLDHVFNASYTPPATVYLALSTSDPTDDASGLSEPSGNGYARKAITFGAAASRTITQSTDVTFDQATGSWGTISHWALMDAETSGNMMAHGAFAESKQVVDGNTPYVSSGEVYIEFQAGEISDYLANALLDFAFRNQALSSPDTYVALTIATVSDSDTGSTISEPSGGAYARVQVNPNGGSSPTWNTASSGEVDNADEISFPTATASWGTAVATAICDASTAGNLLFYDNGDLPDQAIGSGDTVKFAIGSFAVQMS